MKYAIADAILGLGYDSLDSDVTEQAKRILLYHVWTAFLGRHATDMHPAHGFSVIESLGYPSGPCTVIGEDFKLAAPEAVYLNCHLVGGGGYDDVIFPAGMHAGLMIIPVAMAIAEQEHSSGRDFIAAVVAGYEILGKIGRWTWSNDSPRRPGPVFGPMATAGVCAKLLGLDRDQVAAAIGYAAHAAMGLPCNLNTHIHAMACQAGIMSAVYAKAGGQCPPDVIEGPLGFYQTFFGESPDSEADVLGDFGSDYAIMASREKRYPGTLLNLVAVEKSRELIVGNGLTADNVASVDLELSSQRSKHPTAQLRPPYARPLEAFASCQFLVALLLLDGDINKEQRAGSKDDREVLDVADRVQVSFLDHPNPIFARVTMTTTDGRQFQAEGDDYIFSPIDAAEELRAQAGDTLTAERIDKFVEAVAALEEADDVSGIIHLLSGDTDEQRDAIQQQTN